MTSHICGAVRIDGGSCNNPVRKGHVRCWRHRHVLDTESNLGPNASPEFIRAMLNLPESNPEPRELRSWAEFIVTPSEKKNGEDVLVWLRTVITNYVPPHLSHNGEVLGATLVEVPIGEGYSMHVMDTLCPDKLFCVINEPNELAPTTVSLANLSWSSADVTTSIVFKDDDAWGIEGLRILASTKTGKRLKEVTRISKYHETFGAERSRSSFTMVQRSQMTGVPL